VKRSRSLSSPVISRPPRWPCASRCNDRSRKLPRKGLRRFGIEAQNLPDRGAAMPSEEPFPGPPAYGDGHQMLRSYHPPIRELLKAQAQADQLLHRGLRKGVRSPGTGATDHGPWFGLTRSRWNRCPI
jgi:hypothetical protein